MKSNPFETLFREFVQDFGGEVLPEALSGHTADYSFPADNIVAELKTLTEDATGKMKQKLQPIVGAWIRENGKLPEGFVDGNQYIMELKSIPAEIAQHWLRLLRVPADHLISDANRQIRDTKERLNLPLAKGLILIANEANYYHNDPESYRLILANILRKRMPDGSPRFAHLHGAVYFSPLGGIQTRSEGMYFWANLIDDHETPTATFQRRLREGWYAFLEKTGTRVRQYSEPTQTHSSN
jgi:hypothetical protein